MINQPKKKNHFWAIAGVIIIFCLAACAFIFIISKLGQATPSYKSTQTARSNLLVTQTWQFFANQTQASLPTNTLAPTWTATNTLPPTATDTLDPLVTPPTATYTETPTTTPTFTSTPTNTPTFTRTFTPMPTSTPLPETAGATQWLVKDGQMIGVQKLAWDKYISFFVPETGKIFVSLYVIALNTSDQEVTFSSSSFELIDGGGEVTSGVLVGRDPTFSSCTILPGGKCEGWWTTEIWDRPEVKASLTFRWNPCLLLCGPMEAPIKQE
jgi:hypothetical protein